MLQSFKPISFCVSAIAGIFLASLLVGCSPEPRSTPVTTIPETIIAESEKELEEFYTELQRLEFYEYLSTTTSSPPPPPSTTTTVAPIETSAPVVEVVPSGDLEQMICATFVDQCAKALSVVYCESRFDTNTVGAAGERGLFQIHPVHIPYLADRGLSWDSMFDPASNIAYAYDLYSRSGWGPWTCA
jgi:hypothetical protein